MTLSNSRKNAGGAATAARDDLWLDAPEATEANSVGSVFRGSFGLPALWYRRTAVFFATTIGQMTLWAFVLTVALLAAGVAMAQSTQSRQAQLGTLMNNTEPMSAAAQDIYMSLSLADTTATTGFVQAGVEQPLTRERYQRAIQRASAAATQSAAGVQSSQQRELELIATIQSQLPNYTGLVETARTNNRMGNPVGVAYMSEASALMRTSILPAANELLRLTNARVNAEQHDLTRPQWVPISGLVAALLMLVAVQRWLAHRTRRRLNKGMLVATACMTIALLWVSTSNALTWYAGTRGFEQAAAPLNSLANARVLAQQARTAETLALVRRETNADAFESFSATAGSIDQALTSYDTTRLAESPANARTVADVRAGLTQWQVAHEDLANSLNQGDYQRATRIAFATSQNTVGATADTGSAAQAYDAVDAGLAVLILDTRGTLRGFIADGLSATHLLSPVVLLLSGLAVLSLWLGIRPRLQEYL
ncbi:hypothetical protein [Corynebacterium epidermidicanis]|uniref:Chemotaxis methyl-accepting receptor HlyB-like 4HB MCP domain-containing protein n=1 Tax=Corynebacterium epidermidicanis TaxID=1050174 RepID=A0A0G3GU01_9CORY|nr:hypothetical protein [Corynebacterium epidermidicanis]AKK04030.1 hypothetical protein CEPID_11005 [Corynebacterium epidermidicanis]